MHGVWHTVGAQYVFARCSRCVLVCHGSLVNAWHLQWVLSEWSQDEWPGRCRGTRGGADVAFPAATRTGLCGSGMPPAWHCGRSTSSAQLASSRQTVSTLTAWPRPPRTTGPPFARWAPPRALGTWALPCPESSLHPAPQVGCFDPYSDDPRLGVQKVALCKYTAQMVVAGTAGQVRQRWLRVGVSKGFLEEVDLTQSGAPGEGGWVEAGQGGGTCWGP